MNVPYGGHVRAKTTIEWLLTLTTAAVWVPVLAGLACLVWVDSPGPVFYRQTRLGLGGREFTIYKLRTMYVGAVPVQAKTPDNNQITRVGRWLRRSSLDELPQLFNVLLGDMALVGPRPHCRHEADRYNPQRLDMRPGITGLWQISGRSNVPADMEVVLDLIYVAGWSLWADLHICAQTLLAVLRADGAY